MHCALIGHFAAFFFFSKGEKRAGLVLGTDVPADVQSAAESVSLLQQ